MTLKFSTALTVFFAALAILGTSSAWAAKRGITPEDKALSASVLAAKATIEKQLETSLLKETGFSTLQQANYGWKTLRCLGAPGTDSITTPVGSCIISAGAFEVSAEYTIIVSDQGTSVAPIYVMVE